MQSPAPPVNDKYDFSGFDYWKNSSKSEKMHFFLLDKLNLDNLQYSKGVKHRLRNSVEFWRSIQAPDFIFSIIETGYVIPFVNVPSDLYLKNNLSACNNEDFVSGTVSELLESGCVPRVPFKPIVVNPLSVA